MPLTYSKRFVDILRNTETFAMYLEMEIQVNTVRRQSSVSQYTTCYIFYVTKKSSI